MALIVDDNSYLSVADADTYFSDRLNSTIWDNESDDNKSASLIQATKFIDTKQFLGNRYVDAQSLSFPRSGLYVDSILLDEDTVPQDIKDAVCEFAIYLLQDDYTAPNDLDSFNAVSIGTISISVKDDYTSGIKTYPPAVVTILGQYTDNSVRLVRG